MQKIRIVHLTSVHPVFDTRIFRKECTSLAQAGYDVVLLACHEKEEYLNGVFVKGLPKPRNRLLRMTQTAWQIVREALRLNAHIYHFHDPELIPAGIILRLMGKKVLYDIHEDVPKDILDKHYLPRWVRRPLAKLAEILEHKVCQYFDGLVPVTSAIASRFDQTAIAVVQNFPLADELVHPEPTPYAERENIFSFVGGISEIRGIREIVQATEHLPESLQGRLFLAGTFESKALEVEICSLPGCRSVTALGWQSREQVRNLLARSRFGLVTYLPVANHIEAQPTKMFEYMSAGLPVIASDFPLWREIMESTGAGLLVDPSNPEQIAEGMRWILEHPAEAEEMGRNGQRAVSEKYNWGAEFEKLLCLYSHVLRVGGNT